MAHVIDKIAADFLAEYIRAGQETLVAFVDALEHSLGPQGEGPEMHQNTNALRLVQVLSDRLAKGEFLQTIDSLLGRA